MRAITIALTTLLAGCATCHDEPVLHPSVDEPGRFEATSRVPVNGDDLFLSSDDVSLWLSPCTLAERPARGTLCAVLLVPAGRTVVLDGDRARLELAEGRGQREVPLSGKLFDPSRPLVGADTDASVSPLAAAWTRQMAHRRAWFITLLREPLQEAATLRLPGFTVNGVPRAFPRIALAPATMHECSLPQP